MCSCWWDTPIFINNLTKFTTDIFRLYFSLLYCHTLLHVTFFSMPDSVI